MSRRERVEYSCVRCRGLGWLMQRDIGRGVEWPVICGACDGHTAVSAHRLAKLCEMDPRTIQSHRQGHRTPAHVRALPDALAGGHAVHAGGSVKRPYNPMRPTTWMPGGAAWWRRQRKKGLDRRQWLLCFFPPNLKTRTMRKRMNGQRDDTRRLRAWNDACWRPINSLRGHRLSYASVRRPGCNCPGLCNWQIEMGTVVADETPE